MNKFIESMDDFSNLTLTDNGMTALKSSKSALVDLFFAIGSARKIDLTSQFKRALSEDRDLAIRIVLHARDAREGMGERATSRSLLRNFLSSPESVSYDEARNIAEVLANVGRFDDLLHIYIDTPYENTMFQLYHAELQKKNLLAVKWAPRESSRDSRRRDYAKAFRKYLNISPRHYRRMLSRLNDVVENKMSARRWNEIDYNGVPSIAAARYQNAFKRNDGRRYETYVNSLVKGEGGAKINAGAIFPHDVVKSALNGNNTVATEQWKSLPDFINDISFLPLVDTSGSMTTYIDNSSTRVIDVAIALGLYCSEQNKSAFRDRMLTFDAIPKWHTVDTNRTLKDRVVDVFGLPWGFNTNLNKALDMILSVAIKNEVSSDDMPNALLILSDMQFDASGSNTAFTMIEKKYDAAGYKMPTIIWWNLLAAGNHTPVKFNQNGTVLISGYSPAIMKSVFSGDLKNITPYTMMHTAVSGDRYRWTN